MLCNFYLVKNHKIAYNSTTGKAREKISADFLESSVFGEFFDVRLTKFKNNQNLLNKISHRILLTTRLFTGQKIVINICLLFTVCLRSSLFHVLLLFQVVFLMSLIMCCITTGTYTIKILTAAINSAPQ